MPDSKYSNSNPTRNFCLTLSDPMSDLVRHYDFPVPDAFPHVVWTSANRELRLYSFCFCFSLLKL
jgi:hypothetical protein